MSTEKVLMLRSTIACYGAEQMLLNVLQVQPMALACIEGNAVDAGQLAQRAQALAIPVLRLKSTRRFDWPLIRQLRRFIKANAITVLHSHDYKSLIHGYFATLGLKVKRVHQQHGALGNTRAEQLYARIELFFMRGVDQIIMVSQSQLDHLARQHKALPPAHLVLNGSPIPASKPAHSRTDNTFNLLMVARLTAEKNHTLALHVIQRLLQLQIPVKLTLLGDGPMRVALQQLSRDLGVADQVEFAGFQASNSYYQQADLTLITSITEGLPMTLLESLSHRVPAISTAVGQIPSLLKQADCGILCDANVDAFANAILSLYQDPVRRAAMAEQGYQLILQHYSVQQQVRHLQRIYAT